MFKKLTALLTALFLVVTMAALSVSPAFAITQAQAKAQAYAYNKHSIGLTSVENARDLGGYKTKDGRTVKFGKLIRTGDLTNLSAADQKKLLKKYKITKDIDFRSYRNLIMDGQDPELPGVTYHHYPYSSTKNFLLSTDGLVVTTDMLKELIALDFKGDFFATYYREGYGSIFTSEDGIAMIRGFFDELLDANGAPVLFHCVHGKDRTGNAAMLLLTVLGVDKKTIIEDFLLTNDYFADEQKTTYDRVYSLTHNKAVAKDISLIDGVKRDWILKSYETIEENYGSVDNFLKKTIGLSNKDMKKLQKAYLQ
ncbi:MAG: tyrosine-protein phosphatase [Clostridia bacterium]|nr:tyrosine-protein phosphatase [Clostridia bacterium]